MRNAVMIVVVVLSVYFAGLTSAQDDPSFYDPAFYETVLLPIDRRSIPLVGERGSRWRAEGFVRNFSEELVWYNSSGPVCRLTGCTAAISPHSYADLPGVGGSLEGELIHVRRGYADALSFSLRLWNVNGSCNGDITIPVAREKDFRRGAYEFIEVDLKASQRAMLRLYDPSGSTEPAAIRVQIFDWLSGTPLFDQVVPLHYQITEPHAPGFPPAPNYNALVHLEQYIGAAERRVRIRLEPATAGLSYWALLSITDNATQSVRLFWPQ